MQLSGSGWCFARMTVLTKASDMGRKPDLMSAPLVVENRYDPERVSPRVSQRTHVWVYRSHCSLFMLCFTLFTCVMLLAGAVLGLVYYSDAHQDTPRFKGYCAIPIEVPRDVRMQKHAAMAASHMPLHWSSDEPEITLYSTLEEQATGDAINSLLEHFDIDENVEKISVYNSGRNVEFIHDFNANATGIVDEKRCFMMELDPRVVLSPGQFVVNIQRGEEFDVQRVRTRLHALMPPAAFTVLTFAEKCADKPTYKLQKGNDIIRKRSVDEPSHEYLYFAGKHLHEISIDNLPELIDYEKKLA